MLKSSVAVSLGLGLIFSDLGFKCINMNLAHAYEESQYTDRDAYANQWARSDVRAWLNGLTKTDGVLPIDGSNGTKGSETNKNFLNDFTQAELELFEPKEVITAMFNDDELKTTTSEVKTKDKFWLPTASPGYGYVVDYEDQVLSADPSYDLSNYYTMVQKLKNGKANNWENIIPIPAWGGLWAWLRSPKYDEHAEGLTSDRGYDVAEASIDRLNHVCACSCIRLPSKIFTAIANAKNAVTESFSEVNIDGYGKLGKKDMNESARVPSWGMHIKNISLNNLSGTLTYNGNENKLIFASNSALPKNKYLMVQAYKNWDATETPTKNASEGDTIYTAGKKIEDDSTTSLTFIDAPDLSGYTIKVWLEEAATESALAQASEPLTFSVNSNGSVSSISEAKSLNPRVFANKSDLSCSWGTYENDTDCSRIAEGVSGVYSGENATWQKLYIGTGDDNEPIEWWIASNNNGNLVLYQSSVNAGIKRNSVPGMQGTQYMYQFNTSNDDYADNIKNPSLSLSSDVISSDLEI